MDGRALILTISICIASVLIETLGSSKKGLAWFEKLKQPRYSLPFRVWYIVGGLYYIICASILYRLLKSESISTPLALVIIMMVLNGLSNLLLFKMRAVKAFYISIYVFALVALLLFYELFRFDIVSAWILFPYIIWLIYDIYYFHFIWKMNKPHK